MLVSFGVSGGHRTTFQPHPARAVGTRHLEDRCDGLAIASISRSIIGEGKNLPSRGVNFARQILPGGPKIRSRITAERSSAFLRDGEIYIYIYIYIYICVCGIKRAIVRARHVRSCEMQIRSRHIKPADRADASRARREGVNHAGRRRGDARLKRD
jgi:hypothetical protein